MKEIISCKRCVMDNSTDDSITFDENGYCNYCTEALSQIGKIYFPNEEGKQRLEALLTEVKEYGKGKRYDCIMGLSGGLDSSYLAYLGYQWGLRILAVHIDDGYDTEISKSNLKKLIDTTHFDYEVITPDAEQFNDLTLAYMRAGVPSLDNPQDNVLFAFLYKNMKDQKIRYFLSGGNFALESVLQKGIIHTAYDVVNIKDIHKRYGTRPIDKLELLSTLERKKDEYLLGIQSPRPLDYIEYNRDRAFKELHEFCGFEYYGGKHLENILTAFIQCYWLPKKFGIDERTSNLSSMIVSGQMTRDEALHELEKPLYDEEVMNNYICIIKDKLHLSDQDFEDIMKAPTHKHADFQTEDGKYLGFSTLRKVYKFLK